MANEEIKSNMPVAFDYFNQQHFETMQRVSSMFTHSELVPEMYRISENNPKEKAMANCMIAIEMATRIGASPLMVMQNLDIIYGRPSWRAKFLTATVNTCGRFETLKYRFQNKGKLGKVPIVEFIWNNAAKKKLPQTTTFDGDYIDNLECVAYTKAVGTSEELVSSTVSVRMAVVEGWWTKSGSKWPNMTEKMLRYRAASFWTNEYAPELSLGMRTVEEEQDIIPITEHEDVSSKVKDDIRTNANKDNVDFTDEKKPDTKPAAASPVTKAEDPGTGNEENPI